ncbi:unnamed protein product [Lactuca saligna]|uniref:Reverse transcriptase zinc-binding domain-containing protein n=1 Tax=Lactuca saligna TaxID=75948 RepID=A0AA35UYJ8_LACSI|nr:unnamed protein product [Lactuca saligna]
MLAGVWNNIACSQKELSKLGISVDMVLEKKSTSDGHTWTCPLTQDGDYKVNAMRNRLDKSDPIDIRRFEWSKEVPIKVTTFVWRAKQGRIPASMAISNRGITVNSTICSQCGEKEETADHVLVECTFAKSVMKWILIWCQARNDRLFNNKRMQPTKVADIIISTMMCKPVRLQWRLEKKVAAAKGRGLRWWATVQISEKERRFVAGTRLGGVEGGSRKKMDTPII